MQAGILDFDVYGYRVNFVFTNNLQMARDRYDKVIGKHVEHVGAGAFHSARDWKDDAESFLFFKEDADAEQIAHESYHVIARMFRWCGIIEDTEMTCGETVAYHLGHLVGQLTRAQKVLTRGKK